MNEFFINGLTVDDIKCLPYSAKRLELETLRSVERVPGGMIYTFPVNENCYNSVFIPLI